MWGSVKRGERKAVGGVENCFGVWEEVRGVEKGVGRGVVKCMG